MRWTWSQQQAGIKLMLYLKENNKCLWFGGQYQLLIPQQCKTCSCSNHYEFNPFSAHDDILAHTETKKPHKHAVHTLHFYWVCASNVLIYDIDKFLLCLGKIYFLKLVVLINTQQACKFSPGMELLPSFFLSLSLLVCCWSKVWKLYFLIPLHGGELYPLLHFLLITKPEKNHINSKLAQTLSC